MELATRAKSGPQRYDPMAEALVLEYLRGGMKIRMSSLSTRQVLLFVQRKTEAR